VRANETQKPTHSKNASTTERNVFSFLWLFLCSSFLWGSALLTRQRVDSIMKLDQKSKVTGAPAGEKELTSPSAPVLLRCSFKAYRWPRELKKVKSWADGPFIWTSRRKGSWTSDPAAWKRGAALPCFPNAHVYLDFR
jgi:hypothetical protein